MKRKSNYLLVLIVLIQVSVKAQSIITYSVLSTGYDRTTSTFLSPTVFDPDWDIYQRQDLVYSPPYIYPSGSPVVINTPAYVVSPFGPMLTDLNARYINYNSTVFTSYPYYLTYRTYFTLPAFSSTNKRYSLLLKMRGDDIVTDVRLNGTVVISGEDLYKDDGGFDVGGAYASTGLGEYSELEIPYCDTLFVEGENYVEVTCADVGVSVSAMCAEVILSEKTFTGDACVPSVPPPPCEDCIGSFSPIPGKKYLISGWVKEGAAAQSKTSYTYPSLTVKYPSLADSSGPFFASGDIIDGWQRVEGEFLIPALATDLNIKLECTTGDCYFDDIRVFPFDGSMKSYVYDPVNKRLTAELDERNYATLYEYDEEGQLVRVKKETQKGIMTIKENRNNTKKQ